MHITTNFDVLTGLMAYRGSGTDPARSNQQNLFYGWNLKGNRPIENGAE